MTKQQLQAIEDKFFVAGQMDAQGHAAEKSKIGRGGPVLAMSRRLLTEARELLAALDAELAVSRTAEAMVILTDAEIEGLRDYVQWHGAAHAEDCPGDDTCDCPCKPLNDAVNEICRKAFDAQVSSAVAGEPA